MTCSLEKHLASYPCTAVGSRALAVHLRDEHGKTLYTSPFAEDHAVHSAPGKGAAVPRGVAGADRLWMRCVENSRSHRLAVARGWAWWAGTELEGPAAVLRAVLLARPLSAA